MFVWGGNDNTRNFGDLHLLTVGREGASLSPLAHASLMYGRLTLHANVPFRLGYADDVVACFGSWCAPAATHGAFVCGCGKVLGHLWWGWQLRKFA